MPEPAKYDLIIEKIFTDRFDGGTEGFDFPRSAINAAANELGLEPISNVGDAIYSFRARRELPKTIRDTAPEGLEWTIRTPSRGTYRFELVQRASFVVNLQLAAVSVPDNTPALIQMYRQNDEQALLAILRYNRLIDIFTRLSCFSVQSHYRTSLVTGAQIEVDELYVGIDRHGAHYVVPVEVKSATDTLGYNQVSNMFDLCAQKFPGLIARPIGAQFIDGENIALIEFQRRSGNLEIAIAEERHYQLVPADELPREVVEEYGRRTVD